MRIKKFCNPGNVVLHKNYRVITDKKICKLV